MIPLEIEQKFRVSSHESVISNLVSLNATVQLVEHHRDVYLRHPCRDFAITGEAFRIRRLNEEVLVTYKGPKEGGPVKTRSEIELPLAAGTADQWFEIFQHLGFTIADEVIKTRTPYQIEFRGFELCVTCDVVEMLGTFVEIEAIANDRSDVESFQKAIVDLASVLGLCNLEPKSYLRQIIELRSSMAS